MGGKHTHTKWAFKSYIRARAFGWRGSRLAIQRLKEAVSEISSNSRRAPIDAADGAVCLIERLWPAFELIDTSSGALGGAVAHAIGELIPLIVRTPADHRKRSAAGLSGFGGRSKLTESATWRWWKRDWGDLCGSADVASSLGGQDPCRLCETHGAIGALAPTSRVPTSAFPVLLTAGRYQELLEVLALKQHPVWPWRRYGIRALLAQGSIRRSARLFRGVARPEHPETQR